MTTKQKTPLATPNETAALVGLTVVILLVLIVPASRHFLVGEFTVAFGGLGVIFAWLGDAIAAAGNAVAGLF